MVPSIRRILQILQRYRASLVGLSGFIEKEAYILSQLRLSVCFRLILYESNCVIYLFFFFKMGGIYGVFSTIIVAVGRYI